MNEEHILMMHGLIIDKNKMKQQSIKLNFLMNTVLTVSSFIFPLITFPYVSRVLQPEGTGKVALATSVITYFNMFAQLGIPTYGIRAVAKVRDDRTKLTRVVHELLAVNIFMSFLSYVALVMALVLVPKFASERELYIIVSFTIILSAIGMEWMYKGLEQYTYITIRSIIFKLVALIAMFLLIHEKSDYVIYGGITILAASASNIFNLINAHRYISFRPVGNYRIRHHMKPILVFFAMTCATIVYTNLDIFMLGFMKTDVDVGYYNAAVRIKSVLVGVVTSLGAVLLPRCSYYIEHNLYDEFKIISKKALRFVALLASPMALYCILFAREGIYFLSGSAYAGSIRPMQVIMPTLLLIGLTNILGIQILVPLGRELVVLYSEIAGAVTDLVLNAVLIPRMASTGAALGTLAAEVVVLIVQYMYLRNKTGMIFNEIPYLKITIALAISLTASWWVKNLDIPVFFRLAISAICFFGGYVLSLIIMRESFTLELIKNGMDKFTRK